MDEVKQLIAQNIRILNIYPETISDGFGLRYAIYLSGCSHHCAGCHNPESWNPQQGTLLTEEMLKDMLTEICRNPLLDGITLSGGDPMFHPEGARILLKILKEETNLPVWCYTGYTYEEMVQSTALKACLPYIDVLVDGRFDRELFNPSLAFRGSSNQRIIHLHKNS